MVEQEHSKSSTVFPASLISNNSQNCTSNEWFLNDAKSLIKSDELCNSDMLNIELLYGSVSSTDETPCSPLSNGTTERNFFREPLPNDIFSTNDLMHCDLYYNDQNMAYLKDYLSPVSEIISISDPYSEDNSPLSFWGSCPFDLETLKMDDIFQVDKDDLVQSPTLAELNANDESLFDSFDIALPSEQKLTRCERLLIVAPCSNSSEASQIKTTSETSSSKANLLLHMDTCEKDDSVSENEMRSGINPNENEVDSQCSNSLTESAETTNINSQLTTKLVKKTHTLNESCVETSDANIIENISELSLPSNHETPDSEEEDDSEMDCDYSSDGDEESEEETKSHSPKHVAANNLLLQKKKSRYFWQYNIQSKGPKAPKVKLAGKSAVADNFSGVSDPVFTSSNLIKGIKHAGKARRGDGNDLTPNPQKLYNIGLELEKLTSVIEGLIPANELPLNARSKSRKEKNKLASRACRLKKKAQHEANKLKLFGLHKEQKHLLDVINEVKKIMKKSVDNVKHGKVQSKVHTKIEAISMKKCYTEVAGCSAEFVNNVLKKIDLGDKTGGLSIHARD